MTPKAGRCDPPHASASHAPAPELSSLDRFLATNQKKPTIMMLTRKAIAGPGVVSSRSTARAGVAPVPLQPRLRSSVVRRFKVCGGLRQALKQ